MDFFDMLLSWGSVVVPILTGIVTVASLVANLTPTESDNKIVNLVGKFVNFLALYWHNPDTKTVTTPAAK